MVDDKQAQRRRLRQWGPWFAAIVLFVITIGTAPDVLDFAAVSGGLIPVVAAAAALPFGLIATRLAPIAWLVSAGSLLLIWRTIPTVDGDPWPWPTGHGLVLLAFVFAIALRPPANLPRLQQIGTIVLVWAGTAALFGAAVPERLRAGWVTGVTVIAATGAGLRWLRRLRAGRRSAAEPDHPGGGLPPWLAVTWRGFHTAYLGWVRSPPTGPPFAARLLAGRAWAEWLRGIGPWVIAFGIFWIAVASIEETVAISDQDRPFVAALIALPIGMSRRYALLGWRTATLLAIVVAVIGTPGGGQDSGTWPVIQQFVWLTMTFLATVRHDRPTTVWVWATTVAALSAGYAENAGAASALIVATSVLVLIGDLVRTRRLASREVQRQTELSELEKARRTVLEERTRIARDLHDVVAHHMSMVAVQAETAPYRLAELSEPVRAEFTAISASARQALTEIRSLLGVLRSEDHTRMTAPQPGLDQLQQLVDSVAASGVPVELTTSGTPTAIGASAGLSAYRIVQESLANAARHASGAPVRVRVHHAGTTVELRVTSGPPEVPTAPGPPGHGLIGMRERASAAGGSLRAGPLPDGGFEVVAVIPVELEEPTGDQ